MSERPIKTGELVHAQTLLVDASSDGWAGPFATVKIDSDCRFGAAVEDPCGKPVDRVAVLMTSSSAWAMALCRHHCRVMEHAIDDWRSRN